jgi:chromosome segregation ATPase
LAKADLEARVSELEDKLRMNYLQLERRINDLGLDIGKLIEKLKAIDVPEILKTPSRVGELEDLINIISLGIMEMKKSLERLEEKTADVSKLKELEEKISSLEHRFKETTTKLMNLFTKDIVRVREQTESLSNKLGAITSSITSLRKELELLDVHKFLSQLDRLNDKIIRLETQVDELRTSYDISGLEKEIDILKKQLKSMSDITLEKDMKVRELETSLNILANKFKEIDFVSTFGKLRDMIKENEKRILSNELKMEDANKSLQKLAEDIEQRFVQLENLFKTAKHLKVIEAISNEVRDYARNVEATKESIEELATQVESIYYNLNRKVSDIDVLRDEIKKLNMKIDEIKRRVEHAEVKRLPAERVETFGRSEDLYRIEEQINALANKLRVLEAKEKTDLTSQLLKRIDELEHRIDLLERRIKVSVSQPVIIE